MLHLVSRDTLSQSGEVVGSGHASQLASSHLVTNYVAAGQKSTTCRPLQGLSNGVAWCAVTLCCLWLLLSWKTCRASLLFSLALDSVCGLAWVEILHHQCKLPLVYILHSTHVRLNILECKLYVMISQTNVPANGLIITSFAMYKYVCACHSFTL